MVDGGHGARSTHAPSTAGGSADDGSDSEVDQMSAFDVSMARCVPLVAWRRHPLQQGKQAAVCCNSCRAGIVGHGMHVIWRRQRRESLP